MVVAMAAMGVAGLWQLNVAKDRGVNQEVAKAPTKPVVPITTLIKPHQEFPGVESSRRVTATGTYEPDKQFLVADRRLDGKTGYWVVTPMIEQSTGARLVILRGFVTDPAQATKPTATRVSVVGSLGCCLQNRDNCAFHRLDNGSVHQLHGLLEGTDKDGTVDN